uniref:Uncharacterized protein n=1 Tax=Arundo donax TaxID=35708 RepID=A0A0A9AKV6_ARUDO
MLAGLPIAGDPIGPSMSVAGWQQDLMHRFQGVVPGLALEDIAHNQKHGLKQRWLRQFKVSCV